MRHYERVKATIQLDAVVKNVEQVKARLQAHTKIMAVIKADGYGHGAAPIARELEQLECVGSYGVATPEEALLLRAAGIGKPILILGYSFPEAYEMLIREAIRPAVFRMDTARELSEKAALLGKPCKIHIKVDTGMSRIGIRPDESGLAFVREVMTLPFVEIEGIFTHFARADEEELEAAKQQLELFAQFIQMIEEKLGLMIPMKHCANSAGAMVLPQAGMDTVRMGIALYGIRPSDRMAATDIVLTPALSLTSRIIYVKEVPAGVGISYGATFVTTQKTMVATVPVGYGDGYPRGLSGRGYVLIHGRKAPILGRVCMDQFMVDISGIPDAKEGDEVTLIGRNGNETVTIEDLAELSGGFHYEIACNIGKRIPRVYQHKEIIVTHKDYFEDYR